jgi:DNA-binding GntR family transcriptional regulator
MPATFNSIPLVTLRGQIVDRIREAILHGKLKPGERLLAQKLVDQLGASLATVREALIALESEGFIIKKPNSSAFVIKLTLQAAEKLFRIRRLLEAYAFEQAALRANVEQLRRLRQIQLQMVDVARSNDQRRYVEKDLEWHKAVWRISGNEYLESNLERIVLPLFAFSSMRFEDHDNFDLLKDAQTHMPLVTALESGQPELARAQLLKGMDEWLEDVRTFALEGEHEDHQN